MNPYICLAYLCFFDNNDISRGFKKWRKHIGNCGFDRAVQTFVIQMQRQARQSYIYKNQIEWFNVDSRGLIKFLERYEFKR